VTVHPASKFIWQNFRATKRPKFGIFRLIDHTHPAASDLLDDAGGEEPGGLFPAMCLKTHSIFTQSALRPACGRCIPVGS
jgi:hypothetical protein